MIQILIAACVLNQQPSGPQAYAILVGINDYPKVVNSAGAKVSNQLFGCANDARHMESLMTVRYGVRAENIRRLLNKDATGSRFLRAFREIVAELQPGDYLVMFFSGHGAQFESMTEKDKLDEGLVFFDYSIWLDKDVRQVQAKLDKIGVKTRYVIDACYSGGIDRGTTIDLFHGLKSVFRSKLLTRKSLPKGKPIGSISFETVKWPQSSRSTSGESIFLMASQEDQTAIDASVVNSKGEARGLFSLLLVDRLSANPRMSLEALINSVRFEFKKQRLADRQFPTTVPVAMSLRGRTLLP